MEHSATVLDPVMLEILSTRILSIVDEAAKVVVRTSFSTLSNEANDFTCILTDAEGNSLAQNTGAIPSFIGSLPATVRHFLREFGVEGMKPGDVFITNNPWMGTGHLNDATVVKPIYHGDRLVAFSAAAAHLPDVGGHIRSPVPREVFEEGIHIPLMHLLKEGVPDETLIRLFRNNVRTPDESMGDIWALVGALELMQTRLIGVIEDYENLDISDLTRELITRSEVAMREAIRTIPNGSYEATMLTDGLANPFELKVRITVRDDEIEADFDGTSPQQPRAINVPFIYTYAMTAYALKAALLPDALNNEGLFRPIVVKAPEASILSARYPAAVGGRAATGHYVPVIVFKALQSIIPDRVVAGAGSPISIMNVAGTRPDGSTFATVLFFNGGTGARPNKDGVNCLSWPSNISSTPVEIAERNNPLFFHHKRLRPDSGGDGKFRGGLGQDILVEIMADNISAIFVAERTKFGAPGFNGGADGGLADVQINGKSIDNRVVHLLREKDQVLIRTPGGGGYGDPSERDRQREQADMAQGYISDASS